MGGVFPCKFSLTLTNRCKRIALSLSQPFKTTMSTTKLMLGIVVKCDGQWCRIAVDCWCLYFLMERKHITSIPSIWLEMSVCFQRVGEEETELTESNVSNGRLSKCRLITAFPSR